MGCDAALLRPPCLRPPCLRPPYEAQPGEVSSREPWEEAWKEAWLERRPGQVKGGGEA